MEILDFGEHLNFYALILRNYCSLVDFIDYDGNVQKTEQYYLWEVGL
jgi:hypothetical protein